MLDPPVITTVLKDLGTQDESLPPKIYPKWVFDVPSLLAPIKGKVMLISLEQPSNAPYPMLVTLSGMVMLVRPEQPENAFLPMLDPPVITTVLKDSGTQDEFLS